MDRKEFRILESLPNHRDRILQARLDNRHIDELCQDYDTVIRELESGEYINKKSAQKLPSHRDLIQLSRELEREMLERLSNHFQRQIR